MTGHRPWSADEQVFTGADQPLSDWDATRPLMWSDMTDHEIANAVVDVMVACDYCGGDLPDPPVVDPTDAWWSAARAEVARWCSTGCRDSHAEAVASSALRNYL